MLPSDEELIAALPPSPQTVSFRELIRGLNLHPELRPQFRARLRAMVGEGRVARVRGNRYGRAAVAHRHTGTLTVTTRGFGFVALEGGGDDLYVDRRNIEPAMHRDRVEVEVHQGPKGRPEAVVVAVLERGTHTFVGTYREAGRARVVHPQDTRLPEHVLIEKTGGAKDGDTVAAEFSRYPDHPHGAAARVVRVFTGDEEASQETDLMVYDLGLRLRFPAAALQDAAGQPEGIPAEERERRLDLRRRALVTIDPDTAKDFDDAVHAEALPGGGFRVTVAIADVSWFVRPGTALDEEARARSFSVYLPDRVIPMLPHRLSSDLCSLRPDVERLAMAVEFDVTAEGALQRPRFSEAIIRSHARFTYDRVAGMLGLDGGEPRPDDSAEYEGLRPVLEAVRDATRLRRRNRKKRGYLVMELPEPKIFFAPDGSVADVNGSTRHEAHLMVEEVMLAANELVARFFVERDWPALFRVHDSPPDDNVTKLRARAELLGLPTKGIGRATAASLSKWLGGLKEHPKYPLIALLLLRTMAKATYDEEVSPHFGLGAEAYLHFTSPIRRYPDLVVHRLLKRALAGGERPDPDRLEGVANHASRRERLGMEAERSVHDMYKALFLRERVGEEYDGMVVGVTSIGAFVQLDDHMVEGLVGVDRLTDDYYRLDDAGLALVGRRKRIALGDRLRVRVETVSVRRRRVDFAFVARLPDAE